MKLRLNSSGKPKRTLLDVDAFNDIVKSEAFNEIFGRRFRCLKDEVADLEEEESALVAALDESSRKVCGVIKKKKFKWLTSDVTAAAIRKGCTESGSGSEDHKVTELTVGPKPT